MPRIRREDIPLLNRINSRTRKAALLATSTAAVAGLTMGAAGTAHAASGGVWDRVAQCESGGNWSINTGNGFYGGLQFTLQTWHAFGGSGMPNQASPAQQIAVAQRVLASQGPGAWPVCSVKAGLTAGNGGGSGSYNPAPQQPVQQKSYTKHTTTEHHNTQRSYTPRHSQQSTSRSEQRPAVQQAPRHLAQTPQSSKTITVKSGDTLSKLAKSHGISNWKQLWMANVNKVSNPNLILVGQTLHLPA
ncbi:transglycosylase family protein [Leekyejoonella antrihumi]|uniref:transglycosylase family protein n=1 Tax=Leekyejoonella antrihumi TaxID=1660198 RepID=UPI001FE6BBC0|nr:transglycosylase family protein [Leekyejoonella antrihumi]